MQLSSLIDLIKGVSNKERLIGLRANNFSSEDLRALHSLDDYISNVGVQVKSEAGISYSLHHHNKNNYGVTEAVIEILSSGDRSNTPPEKKKEDFQKVEAIVLGAVNGYKLESRYDPRNAVTTSSRVRLSDSLSILNVAEYHDVYNTEFTEVRTEVNYANVPMSVYRNLPPKQKRQLTRYSQ